MKPIKTKHFFKTVTSLYQSIEKSWLKKIQYIRLKKEEGLLILFTNLSCHN